VFNQLSKTLQGSVLKKCDSNPQNQRQQIPSRPQVRKIHLEDEDTLVDAPKQQPSQQQPPQQQQQPSSSLRQQQQQSPPEQLSQQQPPHQQSAAQSILHSVPDDPSLDDTLLQHCNLIADQMSSIAAAAASTKDITLQLHLPIGAADLKSNRLKPYASLHPYSRVSISVTIYEARIIFGIVYLPSLLRVEQLV
jgi:hypothetical protein